MYMKTVRLESRKELSELANTVARLLQVEDARTVDDAVVIRTCLKIGIAYLSSIEKNIEPSKWKSFLVCFASKKGLLQNYNWKQSKEEAIKQQTAQAILEQMRRMFKEDALKVEQIEVEVLPQ